MTSTPLVEPHEDPQTQPNNVPEPGEDPGVVPPDEEQQAPPL